MHIYSLLFSEELKLCTYMAFQCLQAYGFIRISYGIALENTEYGESDLIYGRGF